MKQLVLGLTIVFLIGLNPQLELDTSKSQQRSAKGESNMQLGNFSVSLTVKDIQASKEFYEKLGFQPIHGDIGNKWLILQNAACTIGLFQGMFDKNTLTFNPGWDREGKTLPAFEDVRDLQKELMRRGLTPVVKADESKEGPAFFTLVDPDGNPILFDQHVPKPVKK
jgi:catechol 2,3-dioxygenase-like lactoylglutathione lyase family enzyme